MKKHYALAVKLTPLTACWLLFDSHNVVGLHSLPAFVIGLHTSKLYLIARLANGDHIE
jgi:hypothetical protein